MQEIKDLKAELASSVSNVAELKTEIHNMDQELENQVQELEDEKHKSKVLRAEIQDLKLNKIAQLMQDCKRLQKNISDRVTDIEELESVQRQLKNTIENMESKQRHLSQQHEQQVSDIHADWKKKIADQESVTQTLRQEINQLNLQLIVQEDNYRQKVAEHIYTLVRIDEQKHELDEFRKK
jgi:chromosome segregation ATPase